MNYIESKIGIAMAAFHPVLGRMIILPCAAIRYAISPYGLLAMTGQARKAKVGLLLFHAVFQSLPD